MGTPEFAVPSLEILLQNNFYIDAVVTAPDKPAGRGQLLRNSPVKEFALKNGIPVLQPLNLKSEDFVNSLKELKPDIQVVVAFRMLPKVVWEIPPMGTFNLHASLLPQYRGAAPINWVLINGEKETGLTTFFIDEQIDTGKIMFQEKITIGDNETAGDLHDRMMKLGARLVLNTVEAILNKTTEPVSQNLVQDVSASLKTAPRLTKENCRIDWNKAAHEIHNLVRGLSPYPTAYTVLLSPNGKKYLVKLYKTRPIEKVEFPGVSENPGTVLTEGKTQLMVLCQKGLLEIDELQLEGRRRMKTGDFLRGFPIDNTFLFQ